MRIREITLGVVLTGLLAGIVALTIPTHEPVGAAMPAPAAVALPVPASASAPAPVSPATRADAMPAPAAKPAGTQWRDMHAKFVRAQSLRMFFYEAMRKPEDGAFYYAMQALQTCRLALSQDLQALAAPRREAATELQRRCDFTRAGLEDAQRELGAARHLDLRADPLLGSVFDYLAADGAQGRAAMLGTAFDQGNPEVVASLVATVVEERMPAPSAGDTDSTARGIPFGAVLVACRLGADCGPGAMRTLELCLQHGWCADSVPAALQQGLGPHFAALDAVAARVVDDVRRRATLRLLPKK